MTTLASLKVTFECILIPTDFSDISERALAYAKCVARPSNSQLMLVHVNPILSQFAPPESAWIDPSAVLQQMEKQLEKSHAGLRSEGFRATTLSVTGELQDEVLSLVKRENVDLVVLGTHGKKGLERFLFGSDAEALLRHVSCPVLTIGPAVPRPADKVWHPKNLVCATTLNPDSAGTAAYAYLLAHHFDARFALLNVDGGKEKSYAGNSESFERAFKRHLPEHMGSRLYMRNLLSDNAPGLEIAEYAKERGADLIVMGAHTGSALATHLGHGTATRVFAEATCPVMTLHDS
jgi:nucleotide-binding universal stress UspA family protein